MPGRWKECPAGPPVFTAKWHGPASNSWTPNMDVSWVSYSCWRWKMQLKINATTAKTTTLFKHFINFIPLHTFFVMCQYSLGIDLSLGENLQVTIYLAATYMSKPCKIFVQSCLGNPMETNISMKHQYFTFLEINDRLYTWPIICKKNRSVLYTYIYIYIYIHIIYIYLYILFSF